MFFIKKNFQCKRFIFGTFFAKKKNKNFTSWENLVEDCYFEGDFMIKNNTNFC